MNGPQWGEGPFQGARLEPSGARYPGREKTKNLISVDSAVTLNKQTVKREESEEGLKEGKGAHKITNKLLEQELYVGRRTKSGRGTIMS